MVIPIERPRDAAFSPDGRWLAVCGQVEGLLVDLHSGVLRVGDAFAGELIEFLPTGDRLIVFRISRSARLQSGNELRLLERDGTLLRAIPTQLSVAGELTVSEDGETARLVGLVGNPARHVPMMARAEQSVNLETGESRISRGQAKRGAYVRRAHESLPAQLQSRSSKTSEQRSEAILLNESKTIAVVVGRGQPGGGVAAVWDVRRGRFLKTLGKNHEVSTLGGFLAKGELLANAWVQRIERLSLIDVATGAVQQTPLEAVDQVLIPHGSHFAVEARRPAGGQSSHTLELYGIPVGDPLYSRSVDDGARRPYHWSKQGNFFMHGSVRGSKRALIIVDVRDGTTRELDLTTIAAQKSTDSGHPMLVWSVAADERLDRIALGIGDPGRGVVLVGELSTLSVREGINGLPIWSNALYWLDSNRLLVAHGETVQLYDMTTGRALWTTDTGEAVLQFEHVTGSPVATCGQMYRGACLISLNDGGVIASSEALRGSDQAVALPWTNLPLLAGGAAALELLPDQRTMHLLDTATGEHLLTFMSFPGDQWLVHTLEGHWDGSAELEEWVAFYRGLEPLTQNEIAALRSQSHIDQVLDSVWSAHTGSGRFSSKGLDLGRAPR